MLAVHGRVLPFHLLTSLQADLTDRDIIEFQDNLLSVVEQTNATGAVIDITALDIVDSFMARVINDTASMVRLLGTEVVISGMQPSVALTLIEMGRELIGVQSALNLDQAIDMLQQLTIDSSYEVAIETGGQDGNQ